MWRWINQHDTSMGQRKILSPRQESNPWPPEHRAGALSTELRELMESKVISLSSHMIGVLHTARINAIEFIVSSDKLTKMVNFKLGNEMWRWINQHDMSYVAQWIERPPGVREVMGSIPVGDSEFFFVPSSCHVD